MRPLPALLLLAVLASPAAADEVTAPPAGEATPVPAKASADWRTRARPPSDVPPTAIVRAAERTEKEEKEAGAARRKAEARSTVTQPPPAVEIIWHAPGS